ncbi:MAG: hypothetical protein ACON5K_10145 [Bacteroidia bacterium]
MKKLNIILLVLNIISLLGLAYIYNDSNNKIDGLWAAYMYPTPHWRDPRLNVELERRNMAREIYHPRKDDFKNTEGSARFIGEEKNMDSYLKKYHDEKRELQEAIGSKKYEKALRILSRNF